MKFPNSEKGLKQVFNSMVIALITIGVAIVGFIGIVISAVSSLGSAIGTSLDQGALADKIFSSIFTSGGILLFLAFAVIVAFIVAIVMEIVGIVNCSKDDSAFKSALYVIIALFAFGLIVGFISGVNTGIARNSGFSFFVNLIETAAVYASQIFIVKGIMNLANKLQDKAIESKGKSLTTMLIWTASLGVAASLFAMVKSLVMIAGLVSFAGGVMAIVTFIMYFIFIKRGKEMLADAHD